jgi:hypothetical protein
MQLLRKPMGAPPGFALRGGYAYIFITPRLLALIATICMMRWQKH